MQGKGKLNSSVVVNAIEPRGNSGTNSTSRLQFIDALRGVAALLVVLTHTMGFWDAAGRASGNSTLFFWVRDNIRHLGHGVDIFFVLSGFVIALSIGNSRVDIGYICNFVLRRSARLDPPYWAAIGFASFIYYIRAETVGGGDGVASWQSILAHVFYLQGIMGYEHVIPVFWTLCLEVQLYLGFISLVLRGI